MQPTVVWTEIPVSNLEEAAGFYSKVFGWTMEITDMGPNKTAVFNGSMAGPHGHLYPGTGGAGPTIHLALPGSLETGMKDWEAAGGALVGEPIQIEPGRFHYAVDPDGNSIGLFEMKAA